LEQRLEVKIRALPVLTGSALIFISNYRRAYEMTSKATVLDSTELAAFQCIHLASDNVPITLSATIAEGVGNKWICCMCGIA
jgi:hypothetical protein